MLGRARIVLSKTEVTQTSIIFCGRGQSKPKRSCGRGRFRAKEPLQVEPVRTENALANRSDRAEMSKDEVGPNRNVHRQSRFGPKRLPAKRARLGPQSILQVGLIEARLHAAILWTVEERFLTTIFACAHQNLAGHERQHDVSDGERDREIWHYKCDADNNDRRDYMHIPFAGNTTLFGRVLEMGTAAIRADNRRFVVLSFIGIGFLVLFLGAHPASLRTNSPSMIVMPNALSLHARHFPFAASP